MGLGPTFHLLARESSPVQPEASLTWPRRNPCGGVPPRPGSHAGQLDAEADTAPTSPEALAESGCRCVLFRPSRESSRPTRAPAPPPTPFSQPRLNRPRLARGAPTRPRPALREARGHRETADPANRRSLPGARARTQCTYIGASPRRPFLSTQPLQPPPPCTITLLRGRAEVSFPVPTPMDSGPMAVRTCGKPANQRPLGGVGGVEGDGEVEVG